MPIKIHNYLLYSLLIILLLLPIKSSAELTQNEINQRDNLLTQAWNAYHSYIPSENERAREYLYDALQIDNECTIAYIGIAHTYLILLEQGKTHNDSLYNLVFTYYDSIINLEAESGEAYLILGIVYTLQKETELAKKNIKQAIEHNNKLSWAYFYLSVLMLWENQLELSEKYLQTANSLKGDDVYLTIRIGDIYYELEQWDNAILYWDKAILQIRNLISGYYNLAHIYFMQGLYEKSEIQQAKINEIEPHLANVHNLLGNAYFQKNDYHKALKQYRITLNLDSTIPQYYENLISTYEELGETKKAKEVLQKFVDKFPEEAKEKQE